MSLRRADARFLLPSPPRTARLLEAGDEWAEALAEAGVEVVESGPADMAVAGLTAAKLAPATAAPALVIEGRAPRRELAAAGYAASAFLPLPDRRAPEVILPLGQPRALGFALREFTVPTRRWKLARNALIARLARHRALPPIPGQVIVASDPPGPPFAVAAAQRRLELERAPDWFLSLGEGDALTRGVFHLFEPGGTEPRWVLKFARVPGYTAPFERDERGLRRVAAAGAPLAEHAPRLIERFEVEGLAASLETAIAGRRLSDLIDAPGSGATARRLIGEICAWLVAVATATAAEPSALDPERERLEREVLARWGERAATAAPLARLGAVPAVFEHRDLGSWNLIAGGAGFAAVDWESSCERGFPLWDLVYFLTDALAHLDGVPELAARPEHARRLYRGETASSETLFSWIRRLVSALDLEPDAVGPLVTLCWLHHGVSHLARGDAVAAFAPGVASIETQFQGIAEVWISDPALGPGWDRWRR